MRAGELLAAVVDGGFLHVGTHGASPVPTSWPTQAELAAEIDVEETDACWRSTRRTQRAAKQRAEVEEAELEALKPRSQKAQARLKLAG